MTCIWDKLKKSGVPVVMYGMGNGADKILSRCEKYGIEVSDFFASDSFLRGHSFHGKRVLSFSEVKEKYGKFIILISFASSLPEVTERFYALDKEFEVYCPDVPVAGEGTFDGDFYESNIEKIKSARDLFSDQRSKEVFDCMINFKLTGKLRYLRESENTKDEIIALLSAEKYDTVIDAGAYVGDTAKEFISRFPNVKRIYAVEPDPKNFKKLEAFSESEKKVVPVCAAAYSENTELVFGASSNRNANLYAPSHGAKERKVKAIKLDALCEKADLIKYDVEGAEKDALLGSRGLIERCAPDLIVSAYHRNEDIFFLPALIKELGPEYDLYLRRPPYVPAWDLDIIAVSRRSEKI